MNDGVAVAERRNAVNSSERVDCGLGYLPARDAHFIHGRGILIQSDGFEESKDS